MIDEPPSNDSELAGLIQNEIAVAMGSDQDDLVGKRAQALDYYFGRLPGKPMLGNGEVAKGNSAAISNDVSDMTEALLAQIMPTFTGDNVAVFEADSEQDEQQAQMETDLTNYQIMQRCDGYQVFYKSVKNALLLKNGINKVWVDEFKRVKKEQYPQLDEITLELMQLESEDELYAEDNEEGTLVTRLVTVKRLRIDAVDPTNFVLTTDHRSLDMQDCRFCGESMVRTQGRLIEQGFDRYMVDELPTYDDDIEVDDLARNQTTEEDEHYWYERSSRPIRLWDVYIQLDMDGDGYPELHNVLMADSSRHILQDQVVDWVPYACGAPFMNPHRWLGVSLFDKLKEIADQKTDYIRQWIDNTRYHNNRRLVGVKDQYSREGAQNSRPGGIIEEIAPGMIRELQVTDIGPTCLNALNYLDKRRSERAGASLDMQTEGIATGDSTAHGVERQMAFKEQMAGMITRTLAETLVKSTYLLVHRTMKAFFPGQMSARKSGIWIESDPQTWGDREHVSINVGMSMGERHRQSAALLQVLEQQKEAVANGLNGILTDPSKIYNTVTDYCRAAGISNPDQYWINPSSPQAQQAGQQQGMQAAQAAAEQQDQANRIIGMEEYKAMTDREKAGIDAASDVRDYEFKVADRLLSSEETLAGMTGDTAEVEEGQEAFEEQTNA